LVERKWITGTREADWILLVVGGAILASTRNAEPFRSVADADEDTATAEK